MTEQPDLEALCRRLDEIRERVKKIPTSCAEAYGRSAELVAVREDALALLSLVARLQGERDQAREALEGLKMWALDDGPCWCDDPPKARDGEHGLYCRAARAALGEE